MFDLGSKKILRQCFVFLLFFKTPETSVLIYQDPHIFHLSLNVEEILVFKKKIELLFYTSLKQFLTTDLSDLASSGPLFSRPVPSVYLCGMTCKIQGVGLVQYD